MSDIKIKGLPFDVGDNIVHVKDPGQEIYKVDGIVPATRGDGDRFVITNTYTGETMMLIISGTGLAGWKKAQ